MTSGSLGDDSYLAFAHVTHLSRATGNGKTMAYATPGLGVMTVVRCSVLEGILQTVVTVNLVRFDSGFCCIDQTKMTNLSNKADHISPSRAASSPLEIPGALACLTGNPSPPLKYAHFRKARSLFPCQPADAHVCAHNRTSRMPWGIRLKNPSAGSLVFTSVYTERLNVTAFCPFFFFFHILGREWRGKLYNSVRFSGKRNSPLVLLI